MGGRVDCVILLYCSVLYMGIVLNEVGWCIWHTKNGELMRKRREVFHALFPCHTYVIIRLMRSAWLNPAVKPCIHVHICRKFAVHFCSWTVRKVIQISAIYCNMKCRRKRDTTWNIPRSIMFYPLHVMFYRGKSIIFVTVCCKTCPLTSPRLSKTRRTDFSYWQDFRASEKFIWPAKIWGATNSN